MMDEAAKQEESKEQIGGLLPESFKSTQSKPEGPLQQKSGPYQGKSSNFSKGGNYQNNNNRGNYHSQQ